MDAAAQAVDGLRAQYYQLDHSAGGRRILREEGRPAAAALTEAAITYSESWPGLQQDLGLLASRLTRWLHAAEVLRDDLVAHPRRAPRFYQELHEFIDVARTAAARLTATAAQASANAGDTEHHLDAAGEHTAAAPPAASAPAPAGAAASQPAADDGLLPLDEPDPAAGVPSASLADAELSPPATTDPAVAADQPAGADLPYAWRDGDEIVFSAVLPAEGGYLSRRGDGWAEHWRGEISAPHHTDGPVPAARYPMTLTEARALGDRYRLEVRIVHAAGTPYVTLCEPGTGTTAPVLSFAAGEEQIFAGGRYMPAGDGAAFLAAYRAAAGELTADGGNGFTASDRPVWAWRVAHLTPYLAGPDHDPRIREHLAAAIGHARRGDDSAADRELAAAENARAGFVLAPVRAAQIIEVIQDDAARFARIGDPARYIAESSRVDGRRDEWEWIEGYIAAHPQVLERTPLSPEDREARSTRRRRDAQERATELARQAQAAHTGGDDRHALVLLDEAELHDPERPGWAALRAQVRTGLPASPAAYQVVYIPDRAGEAAWPGGSRAAAHARQRWLFTTRAGLAGALEAAGLPREIRDADEGTCQHRGGRWQWGPAGQAGGTSASTPDPGPAQASEATASAVPPRGQPRARTQTPSRRRSSPSTRLTATGATCSPAASPPGI